MSKRFFTWLTWPIIGLVYLYKIVISPLFPRSCRFYPSCSVYAVEALKKYGPFKGFWMAVKRIARCHPGNPGGYDPVP